MRYIVLRNTEMPTNRQHTGLGPHFVIVKRDSGEPHGRNRDEHAAWIRADIFNRRGF